MRNLWTNHGLALMRIWMNPDSTLSDIADTIGVKERAAYLIVRDLEREGFIEKVKVGRRNRYHINVEKAMSYEPLPGMAVRDQIYAVLRTMRLQVSEGEPTRTDADSEVGSRR
jgi:hypothetical protein